MAHIDSFTEDKLGHADLVEEVERTQEEWDDKKKEYRDKLMKNLEKQQELERLEKVPSRIMRKFICRLRLNEVSRQ
mgnify:CR=1 FL=1